MTEVLSPELRLLTAAVGRAVEQITGGPEHRGDAGAPAPPRPPGGTHSGAPDPGVIDWSALLQLAQLHGVVGLLHEAPTDGFGVPEQVRRQVAALHDLELRRSIALCAELVRVLDVLESRRITAMPIKGPLLAQRVYGNIGRRSFWDLDLLVAPELVPRARDALLADGYRPEVPWSSRRQRRELRRNCEYNFDHPRRGVHVELHWRFVPRHLGFDCGMQQVWQHRELIRFLGRSVPVPSVRHELPALLIHHGGKHGWERLRMVADIALYLRRQRLPPRELRACAERAGVRRILDTAVVLLDRLLGICAAEELLSAARCEPHVNRLVDAAVERLARFDGDPPEDGLGGLITYLHSRERRRDRLRYLPSAAAAVLTPGEHEQRLLPLPRALRWLHVPLRLLRLPVKYLGLAGGSRRNRPAAAP